MNITGPVRTILVGTSAVTDVVGSRIYADIIKQGATLPALAIRAVVIRPATFKNGVATVDNVTLQIDAYAREYAEAQEAAEAVRGALDRYRGGVIQGCSFSGLVNLPFDIEDDVYRVGYEFELRFLR